jgi:serine/threonine protein phosphatase PrpC
MSGEPRGRPRFVAGRRSRRPWWQAAAAADGGESGGAPPLSFAFDASPSSSLAAAAGAAACTLVEEHFEEDRGIRHADLDAPQGTPLPRRRLVRAATTGAFSLARALAGGGGGGQTPAAAAADVLATAAGPHWPSAVAAFTRKGYLRGDPGFKPQNQDRAFVVVVAGAAAASSSSAPESPPPPPPPLLLLGVCDGHGADGHHVSDWLARDFPHLLARRLLPEPRSAGEQQRQTSIGGGSSAAHFPLPLPFGRRPPAPPPPPPPPPTNNDAGAAAAAAAAAATMVRPLGAPPVAELARWRAAFADADALLPERCCRAPQGGGGGGGRAGAAAAAAVVDSGSTLCAVALCAASGELTAGWVGDSRASLGGWRPPRSAAAAAAAAAGAPAAAGPLVLLPPAVALTDDHKPDRPDERARVLLHGGRVEPMRLGPPPGVPAGPARVWCPGRRDYPGLAMSRAFGDLGARPAGVVSEPEVLRWGLLTVGADAAASSPPSSSAAAREEEGREGRAAAAAAAAAPARPLLLVASDGVFEYLDDDDAVRHAARGAERAASRGATRDEAAAAACRAVVDAAERRWRLCGGGGGYCDDITAVVALWG